jgi:hypothetical protein
MMASSNYRVPIDVVHLRREIEMYDASARISMVSPSASNSKGLGIIQGSDDS